jgi:PST family polysaccharide transporter
MMYHLMSEPKVDAPDTPLSKSLTHQTADGFLWMLAQTFGSKIFSFATQIVLARLLAPRDFGLVALTYTVVALVAVIRNTGLQQILVQRQRRFGLWANSAFWLELTIGLTTAVTVAVAAPIAAAVYHNKNLIGLILVVASATPLSAWFVVPSAKLMIDMRFRALAATSIGYNLAAMGLSVTLAALGFGAYSFVIPLPVAAVLRNIWLWRLARPPVSWRPQFRRWRFLVGDGFYMIAAGFLSSTIFGSGSLALGLFYTKAVVGQFFFAQNLSMQVAQLLSQNLGNVLLPALAKLQNDRQRLVNALLRALRMLSFLAVPTSLLVAVAAYPIIVLVYGAKWAPAVPLLQVMAVGMVFNLPGVLANSALQSQGRFGTIFVFTLLQFPLFIVGAILGARFGGAMGEALAWSACTLATSPTWLRLAFAGEAGWREAFGVYSGPLIASGVALAPGLAVLWLCPSATQGPMLRGVAAGASLVFFYPLSAWLFCRAEFVEIAGLARALGSRLRRAR